MAIDKIQVEELLGSGLSNDVVASAIGCDPSYISQLLSDEEFYNRVVSRRTRNLQKHSERDNRVDSLQDVLLEKLEAQVPMMYKSGEILNAYKILNSAKKQGPQATGHTNINQTVVNIRLPDSLKQKYVLNGSGEVVEVDGQTLVTMGSQNVLEKVRTHGIQKEKEEQSLVLQKLQDLKDNNYVPKHSREIESSA